MDTIELIKENEIVELIEKTSNINKENHATWNLDTWVKNEAPIYYKLILLARFNDKINFVKTLIDYNDNIVLDNIDINNVNINSIYDEFKENEAEEIDTKKIINTLVKYGF